jgi:5-methylcytosine-specific restriction endonuclease McrA
LSSRNPRYIALVAKIIRKSPRYEKWRRDVIRKNGYKCVGCKVKKGLDVHHRFVSMYRLAHDFIESYGQKIKTAQDVLDYCEEDERIWDVDNGIVLCRSCHELEHIDILW